MDDHLAVLAMVCTSFVAINKGTNKRETWSPLGDQNVPSVVRGNIFASRSPVAGFGGESAGMSITLRVLVWKSKSLKGFQKYTFRVLVIRVWIVPCVLTNMGYKQY